MPITRDDIINTPQKLNISKPPDEILERFFGYAVKIIQIYEECGYTFNLIENNVSKIQYQTSYPYLYILINGYVVSMLHYSDMFSTFQAITMHKGEDADDKIHTDGVDSLFIPIDSPDADIDYSKIINYIT